MGKKDLKIVAMIPARYNSSRFPGKPLAQILGKSLIQRTYENVRMAKSIDEVIVATDDQRIFDHVFAFGGKAIFTSEHHQSGSDRIAEIVQKSPEYQQCACILNVQGDEPCLDSKIIDNVALSLIENPEVSIATAISPIQSEAEALNPSIVKCVIDRNHFAIYFSRQLIPANKKLEFDPATTYYRHYGIYGYRPAILLNLHQMKMTPLRYSEDLEQLMFLEYGFKIKVALGTCPSFGVDHPEDITKVEQLICKQDSFL